MHILVIELIQLKICGWYQLCQGCSWIDLLRKAKCMFCCTESHLKVDLYLQNNHLIWEDISSCYFLCSHHNWEWLVADYWLLLKYCFLILNKGWNVLVELLNADLFISASSDVALINWCFNVYLSIILLSISLYFI